MVRDRTGALIPGPANEVYEIGDLIGGGAFGEVWTAKEKQSGKVVAAKLLPLAASDDPGTAATLLNEIETASQIRHVNVVSIFYGGSTPELGPYMLMEYLPDGNLADFLKAQRSSKSQVELQRALEMMRDIAQGVRAVNEKLIHRDLKPDNVLLQGTRLKIADFGLSKFVDQRTRTLTFKGIQHLHYMAPEVWEGQPNSTKIDVYSVGLIYYELLTLEHPLRSFVADPSNPNDWRRAHLFTRPPNVGSQRKELPPELSQLVTRMVAKRPQDRPDWDEVLRRLSGSESPREDSPAISRLVELATSRQTEAEKRELERKRHGEAATERNLLYNHSCGELLSVFDGVADRFNKGFQLGQISIQRFEGGSVSIRPARTYHIPTAGSITCAFFDLAPAGMRIQNRELLGGGFIGIDFGPSANLLLLKESADDLYGSWGICSVEVSALIDGSKLIGRYGLTPETVIPFGFHEQQHFYDQIRYASGGMHVFVYRLRYDPEAFFLQLVETSLAAQTR